jgi:hypothetical protein
MLRQTVIRDPDLIELVLVGILAIWTVSIILLIRQAVTITGFNILSWTSLTTFFMGFTSIVALVIAVIVADIRKEIVSRR